MRPWSLASSRRRLAVRHHERTQVIGPDADRVDDPNVRKVAALAQAVHSGGADAQMLCDLGHPEEATATAV
jgi:hypothetical protein